MGILVESFGFGLAVGFMALGLLGVFIPIIPGIPLIWLTLLVHTLLTGFATLNGWLFALLTLVALGAAIAEIWLPLLGASTGGATRRSLLFGSIGAVIGLFVGSLPGSILGYALGILGAEYLRLRDWQMALKASLGGVAGWGVATAVQFVAGLVFIGVFAWRDLSAGAA